MLASLEEPMRRLSVLSACLLLAACAHKPPEDLLYQSVGADRAGAPAPNQALELDLQDIDQQAVLVPDPDGRHVVIELIRSADW